ncbi:MAG: M20 family metallopeptidase [Abditibacteriales bacterium]|nr:M20 family metallopeptidase [Abditibacteriales bacterium]MDW8364204.1 M20 family metallopeptidase [Abditibacteriales bacterium]
MSWTRSDNEVLATLQDAVAIDSVNPDLPSGTVGEKNLVAYLSDFFRDADIPFETYEVLPNRPNIVARLEGKHPHRALLFEAHLDTASVSVMTIDPFRPVIADGKLYGRGACDTKAGLVGMIHALRRWKQSGEQPNVNVLFCGAIDEEHLFRGALHLAENFTADGAVIAEPTELHIIRAHKGLARFRLIVHGRAAHSAKPHLGINAITKMARVIRRIEEDIVPTLAQKDHSLTGGATLNIGVIHGGVQVNFVPDRCTIEVDRRVIPGETPDEAVQPFYTLLERMKQEDAELHVTLEPFLLDAPMETPEDADICRVASEACRHVLGRAAFTGVPYGTDASKFTRAGIPAVVFGPGSIDQAHGAVEWVECEQVLQATEVYFEMIRRFE